LLLLRSQHRRLLPCAGACCLTEPFLMIRRAGISRDGHEHGHGHTVTVTDN
jgi:hypothetical protein